MTRDSDDKQNKNRMTEHDTEDEPSNQHCGWADRGEICESTDVHEVVTSHGLPDVETPKTTVYRCEKHIQRMREVNFRTVHEVRGA